MFVCEYAAQDFIPFNRSVQEKVREAIRAARASGPPPPPQERPAPREGGRPRGLRPSVVGYFISTFLVNSEIMYAL